MDIPYSTQLNKILQPQTTPSSPLVLDLFAGCGGLSLGFEAQGFRTIGYEQDADACATYRDNLVGDCIQATLSPDFPFVSADVVIGGPPCQPFSVGGYQHGKQDARDGFPTFIKAIATIKPKLWLFENVRGLLYRNRAYLDGILQELEALGYQVDLKILNAVHFGVPQKRERLIVVGHYGGFKFPTGALPPITAGEALADLADTAPPESKFLTASMDTYVAKYERASQCKVPRDLHLDKPSRTLTCRNIAAPTGDMMRIRLSDGRRRRLLIREAARLQSFPDTFTFVGNETSCFYQIGNAVPPLLAYHLAGSVKTYLADDSYSAPIKSREDFVQLSLFANEMMG